jgi:hypothetical protein
MLGDEVVTDVLETGEGQGANVVDDVRHGWFGFERFERNSKVGGILD